MQMAVSVIKNAISVFYNHLSNLRFLHDSQNKKQRSNYEERKKEWVCDEMCILPRPVQSRLKGLLKKESDESKRKGNKYFIVKDYLVIDLGLQTGLRVQEMCDLELRDLFLKDVLRPYIAIRHGKGNKYRRVRITKELVRHLKKYINWKKKIGEPVHERAPLFYSVRSEKFVTMTLQESFYRWIKKVTKIHHSIHDLRHTYASELLVASGGDFLLVSRQLGHSSVAVTMEFYAHVIPEHADKSLEKLYK